MSCAVGLKKLGAKPQQGRAHLVYSPSDRATDATAAVVRLADITDLPVLAPLIEHYWDFERITGFNAARITALLTDLLREPNRGQTWVAQKGGFLVGYLLVAYLFSLEHGGLMAEIDEFFVIPENRALNIGAALLERATAAMAQRGITHVQLQLGTNNPHGKRFYENHGFRELSGYGLLHKSLQL